MPKTAQRTEREVRAKERQRQVLQLRLSGVAYATIGKQLGISDVMAIKVYKRALAAIVAPEASQERKAQTQIKGRDRAYGYLNGSRDYGRSSLTSAA